MNNYGECNSVFHVAATSGSRPASRSTAVPASIMASRFRPVSASRLASIQWGLNQFGAHAIALRSADSVAASLFSAAKSVARLYHAFCRSSAVVVARNPASFASAHALILIANKGERRANWAIARE